MIINLESKEVLNAQIEENLRELNSLQNLYNTKQQIFSTCLQNTNDEIQKNMKKEEIDFFMSLLSKSKNSLDFLRTQSNLLKESISLLKKIQEKSNQSENEIPTEQIEKFNTLYNTCKTNFYNRSSDDEVFILDYINSSVLTAQNSQIDEKAQILQHVEETGTVEESSKSSVNSTSNIESSTDSDIITKIKNAKPIKEESISISKDLPDATTKAKQKSIFHTKTTDNTITVEVESPINVTEDNTTLLISEVQNKVVLPYQISDLEKTLKTSSSYQNLQEIVNDKYIYPLSNFKNSSKSRFKEGFALMRKKEKASFFNSLDLAFEVTFNSSLNPAVIAACKNLNELDTYLDCLDANQLDRFNCFNIKYEILPTKTDKDS